MLICSYCEQLKELPNLPVCQTLNCRNCSNLTYTLDYLTRHQHIANSIKRCGKLEVPLTKAARGGGLNKRQLYQYKLKKYQYKLQQL
jgi:hypothetical protein